MNGRVIIVCGGRDYDDHERVFFVLDLLHDSDPIGLVRHGRASGADQLADEWGRTRGIPRDPMPAEWSLHGRAAGPIRNAEMLVRDPKPSLVVAFPGGRGTADMVQLAKAAGVEVLEIEGRIARGVML